MCIRDRATPYQQQVRMPRPSQQTTGARSCATAAATRTSTTSTTTSTASHTEAGAGDAAMVRSSARGPGDQSTQGRRHRSSTRGSRKRKRGIPSENPLDDLNKYTPSGWARDLLHITGCYYARYVGPTMGSQWEKDSQAFLDTMSCLLYTSPSPRDATLSRMPSSA